MNKIVYVEVYTGFHEEMNGYYTTVSFERKDKNGQSIIHSYHGVDYKNCNHITLIADLRSEHIEATIFPSATNLLIKIGDK